VAPTEAFERAIISDPFPLITLGLKPTSSKQALTGNQKLQQQQGQEPRVIL